MIARLLHRGVKWQRVLSLEYVSLMALVNKIPRIYFRIFQQAFEVNKCCISSAEPVHIVCVDIFTAGLFLELRICAEVYLYLRKSLATLKLVVRSCITSNHVI